MLLGSIEAGGTKFVCGIGTENGEILKKISIPTTSPQETLKEVIQFFIDNRIDSLGIGTFGPADIKKSSPTYGYIMNTPKLAWQNYPLFQVVQKELTVPIGFTTDVNTAVLAENTYGAAVGLNSCLYITIGTGIGAGAIVNGKLLEGLSHPEMGHIIIRKHEDDIFQGICPFHRDCLEGLASGAAIEKRWGKKGTELAQNLKVWELEAYYIAQALVQYIMICMPEKIIIGGGVSNQRILFPMIRKYVQKFLNGYFPYSEFNEGIDVYIVPTELNGNAGLIGGFILAKNTLIKQNTCPDWRLSCK